MADNETIFSFDMSKDFAIDWQCNLKGKGGCPTGRNLRSEKYYLSHLSAKVKGLMFIKSIEQWTQFGRHST